MSIFNFIPNNKSRKSEFNWCILKLFISRSYFHFEEFEIMMLEKLALLAINHSIKLLTIRAVGPRLRRASLRLCVCKNIPQAPWWHFTASFTRVQLCVFMHVLLRPHCTIKTSERLVWQFTASLSQTEVQLFLSFSHSGLKSPIFSNWPCYSF